MSKCSKCGRDTFGSICGECKEGTIHPFKSITQEPEKEYSPLAKEYFAIKASHPDYIVLVSNGKYYQAFGDDAFILNHKFSSMILTQTESPIYKNYTLTGFESFRLQDVLRLLILDGFRVITYWYK